MVNQMSVTFCTLLDGCGDLAQRLPTFQDIFLCAGPACLSVWLLSALHGWRPVVFSAVLVVLTDLFMYVRLAATQWPQGDAAMAAVFSGFCIITTLSFSGMFASVYPDLRSGLRLITPLLSVGLTLALWLQHGVRG